VASTARNDDSATPVIFGDVIALPAGKDRWIVVNVFTRIAAGVDSSGLAIINGADIQSKDFPFWDIARFSNVDGLLADPSRFVRDANEWPEPVSYDAPGLQGVLRERFILVDDLDDYLSRFGPKSSILDREKFGSFHQQLGQALLEDRRQTSENWWVNQKFTDDMSALKETLYKAAEGAYLSTYFPEAFGPGQNVLDLGCGPGFYARMIAETGAKVLGLDPNPTYIEYASRIAQKNTEFATADVGHPGGLAGVPDLSMDTVFISDALLFYFFPPEPDTEHSLDSLFSDIRRVLKPDGRLISVEPHHVFWLQPWLGEVYRPYTIISEYRNKHYGVAPTPAEFVGMFSQQEFAVVWMDEIYAVPGAADISDRASAFASEFPIGQIYELRRRPDSWT